MAQIGCRVAKSVTLVGSKQGISGWSPAKRIRERKQAMIVHSIHVSSVGEVEVVPYCDVAAKTVLCLKKMSEEQVQMHVNGIVDYAKDTNGIACIRFCPPRLRTEVSPSALRFRQWRYQEFVVDTYGIGMRKSDAKYYQRRPWWYQKVDVETLTDWLMLAVQEGIEWAISWQTDAGTLQGYDLPVLADSIEGAVRDPELNDRSRNLFGVVVETAKLVRTFYRFDKEGNREDSNEQGA